MDIKGIINMDRIEELFTDFEETADKEGFKTIVTKYVFPIGKYNEFKRKWSTHCDNCNKDTPTKQNGDCTDCCEYKGEE